MAVLVLDPGILIPHGRHDHPADACFKRTAANASPAPPRRLPKRGEAVPAQRLSGTVLTDDLDDLEPLGFAARVRVVSFGGA